MKKRVFSLLILLCLLLAALPSCSLFGECTVTYDLGGAGESIEIKVDKNARAPEICAPTLAGHKFLGWYEDKEFTRGYDFSAPVTGDVTIYAKYVIGSSSAGADASDLINSVTQTAIKASVMLNVEKYELGGMLGTLKTNLSTSSGSGIVFAEVDGYYYCLTNNHVVASNKTYRDIVITDYQCNKYDGELVAADPEYDLAVVKIKKSIVEPLEVLDIAASDPAVNDTVIALGAPSGQLNAVTLGKVLKYSNIEISGVDEEKSHVTFPVIWHSAPMDNGSSGGAIINTAFEIVGINYAAATKDGDFVYGLSVPVSKLHEFLEKSGITVHKS